MANAIITWDPDKLERFRKVHESAEFVKGRDGTFFFDGHLFVVGYAGYLIEYLDQMFGKHNKNGQ